MEEGFEAAALVGGLDGWREVREAEPAEAAAAPA
jgi:hypothetical protein